MKKREKTSMIKVAFQRLEQDMIAQAKNAPELAREDLVPYRRLLGRWRLGGVPGVVVEVRSLFHSEHGEVIAATRVDGTIQNVPAAALDQAVQLPGTVGLGPIKGGK